MKSVSTKKSGDAKQASFPIVAIGASTGGADSFMEMLLHLPVNTGMSYIYIQHPDPEQDGNLIDAFQRSSKLIVQQATESTKLAPNQVYVVPPTRNMNILDGKLKLVLKPVKKESYLPINEFFFNSLADQYRENPLVFCYRVVP